MRKVWLLASAVLAFLNFVKSQEVARTLYSTRYDNLDIDTILGSNRLVSNYVDCLLSRKPCPPEGKDLKRILPEALRTKCARCSPIQKENALKIITRLYYDYPDQYRALRERWDPSGEYHRRFEEYLRGLQFNQIGGGGSGSGSNGGNTIESGGNDRPVRNDLDRQPASTQSSNVQPIVIDPTLAGQPSPTSSPPQPPLAVAPATERPRPPAPVAQILFPTTTDTTNNTTIITTTTSTTTSTRPSNSGPVELTGNTPSASIPFNTVTISSSIASSSPFEVGADSIPSGLPGLLDTEPDSPATAGAPVVPVPAPPPVVVNRFGDDGGNSRPSIAPVPVVPVVPQTTTTTTQRPTTTTVRQTRPATRQTTTRNTQRTTTRFITRVPQTPPSTTTITTTPRTITTTRTSTILQQRPLLPAPPPPQPFPAQQQPILPPPQQYPTIVYERPQAPPRASPPPPKPLPPTAPPARPFYIPQEPPRTPPTQYGQTTPDSIIDHFFVPPSQAASLPPSPIVGLWNQLGTKIADTADAIAGMLQKTVDVLVTSHIQSHQRALRRI
ncbi:mucin-2-like isoform X1 [Anopheles maculipalpis]|uniref:mucin-2-like isoform X1 n=1 Tax=Anopheles maculipalpis TaxID=1496333 RepID=UPI0021592FE5|nr:mucin-2-like isoform X1 [Anopheles maculipalpis]XP_050077456.1 mucin-2-like isoform X1 [Anopheles maculipalpis]